MSPRPRTVADADILAAAGAVAAKVGPARLTLALVARRVGLSPPTLVQRFGSKLGLMRAMARAWTGWIPVEQAELRRRYRSPLAGLRAYLLCFAGLARTPRDMAHHLGFLQLDLTDPVLHRLMREGMRRTEAGIQTMIDEAGVAGELVGCESASLARTLNAVVTGALVQWAVHGEGSAADWLRREVDAVLAPYVARGKG